MRRRSTLVKERTLASVPRESLAHEGITCVTCHVRDGAVLTANPNAVNEVTPVTNYVDPEFGFQPTWQPLNPPHCTLKAGPGRVLDVEILHG